MSEFQPGLVPVVSSKWHPHTSGGLEIVSIQGPDLDGYFAGTIKDKSGRLAGHSFFPDGTAIDAPQEYNLVSAHKPNYKVKYAQIILNELGLPMVISASDSRFDAATTALIFDNKTLVGSKAL